MRSLSLSIALTLALSLAACSSSDDSSQSGKDGGSGGSSSGTLKQPGETCLGADDCLCVVCECDGQPGGTTRSCSGHECAAVSGACSANCAFSGATVTNERLGTPAECPSNSSGGDAGT